MKPNHDELAHLLNDYHNSEQDLYFQNKEALLTGVTLTYSGPELNCPLPQAMDWFYFIEVLSKGKIQVNYQNNIDQNINLWFFSDERIELTIKRKQKILFSSKTNLEEYSAFQIQKTLPNLGSTNTQYKIYLKLLQSGPQRANYEQINFSDPSNRAVEIINNLVQEMKLKSTSIFLSRPQKLKTYKERCRLWGFTVTTKKNLIKVLPALTASDFGLKDLIKIELLQALFWKDNLSNNKMLINIDKILRARRTK